MKAKINLYRTLFFTSTLIILTVSACSKEEKAPAAPPPLEVQALKVKKSDLPISMEFVGQTKGSIDAEIRARVEGVITDISFKEGQEVKEGQLLYKIDPATYKAKVAEAQASVAQAESTYVKAKSDLDRIRPLTKAKALSERDLDRAIALEATSRASIDAAKAGLEAANIQLSYCNITSPTLGVIGLTKAKIGEFVGRSPNPIVLNTVSKLDPILVQFSLGEKDYLYFSRLRQKQISAGESETKRILEMVLVDGSIYPEKGEVTTLGRAIDPATGTIPVEASFANPDHLIRPGQFVKIKTVADTATGVITVPKRALRELQGQFQVVIVKADNTAEPRNVTLGTAVGDNQVIESGLSENEIIATAGLERLKAGMSVTAKLAE